MGFSSFFAVMSAIPAFFFCAWIAMMFWGIIAPDLGVKTINYPMAMLGTLGLWLIVAPLAAAVRSGKRR
jgi:hypothetical protein